MPKNLKNRKIKICSIDYDIDDRGDQWPTLTTVAEPWGLYRHMSGKESIEGGLLNVSEQYVNFEFSDPHIPDLRTETGKYWIVFDNAVYDIVELDDYLGQPNGTITAICTYNERQTEDYLESLGKGA